LGFLLFQDTGESLKAEDASPQPPGTGLCEHPSCSLREGHMGTSSERGHDTFFEHLLIAIREGAPHKQAKAIFPRDHAGPSRSLPCCAKTKHQNHPRYPPPPPRKRVRQKAFLFPSLFLSLPLRPPHCPPGRRGRRAPMWSNSQRLLAFGEERHLCSSGRGPWSQRSSFSAMSFPPVLLCTFGHFRPIPRLWFGYILVGC